MRVTRTVAILSSTVVLTIITTLAQARVTSIEITRVEPVFEGTSFGHAGLYEKVVGRAHGEVDPNDPLNAGIVNIDKAPTNADGKVEYTVDIYLLKPVKLRRGNGRIFYNVLNRGNKQAISNFNDPVGANANEPTTANDAGNGFLMREGYVILWSAWQGDVAAGGDRMLADLPIPTEPDGSSITGLSRDEFIFNNDTNPITVNLSYSAASDPPDPSAATLTVRQFEQDPRQTPADMSFTYISPTSIMINRPAGFDMGAIYDFTHLAKDPKVMGLGFAAMRDVVSFLRYQGADDNGTANPLNGRHGKPAIAHVLAFGSSQAGRTLRDFLWQGFNEDEDGRKVFDGIIPHKPGSRKTFTNFAFGQPGRFSRQHEDHDMMKTGDQFPFTYETRTDPISGKTDGLLVRCRASRTCPKIMQTETGTEYWGARASLVTTDEFGTHDIALPENVRDYLFSSTQHGPAATPSRGICQQLSNPLPFSSTLRALLVALDKWVSYGVAPPLSRVPRIANGTLVPSLPQAAQGFPSIPNVTYTGTVNELNLFDFSFEPPVDIPGTNYTVLVPKVDADGNDIAGVRHPLLSVPTATHTGWNLRAEGYAVNEGCSLTGSYIPFTQVPDPTDPRRSLEERYGTQEGYACLMKVVTREKVRTRFLLQEDADLIAAEAAESNILPGNAESTPRNRLTAKFLCLLERISRHHKDDHGRDHHH